MALTDKLTAIADAIRGKTGSAEKLTLAQMPAQIAGIQAGSAYPEKFYETDFVMDESITANGVICTISTGLSDRMVTDGNELVMCVITCEPTATPTTNWVKKLIQFIAPNQGTIQAPAFGFYVQANAAMTDELRKSHNSAVGAYLYGVTVDLSSLTIYARFNHCPPAVGNYHLELYKLGVTV